MVWINRERRFIRWIEAERAGRDGDAEAMFHAVIRGMARLAPSPGFVDRVLVASGLVSAPDPWLARWWTRVLVGFGLGLAGLAVLSLPVSSLVLSSPSYLAPAVSLFASAGVSLMEWTRHAVIACAILANVGEALQLAVRTPQVLALIAASASVAMLALLVLGRLLASPEEMLQC
jgi:hypothetical protein